jgi:hypothetical protein
MRDAFLEVATDLKRLYLDGAPDSVEEEELWNQLNVYLSLCDDETKIRLTIETLLLWEIGEVLRDAP